MDRIKLLEELGAIKRGHFLLTSGLHSDTYIEKFRLFEHPHMLFKFIEEDLNKIAGLGFDAVIGPQLGGAFVACSVASLLKKVAIYVEKDAVGDFYIGRGFKIEGKKLLLVDDVLTTGSSIKKILKLLDKRAEVSGIYVLVDRREKKTDNFMGIPLISGTWFNAIVYEPDKCPLCKKKIPLTTKKTDIIK